MGFFHKTPEEKENKILRDEQRADDKVLKQTLKDVERANKAELKAAKDEHNAVEDHQRAIRRVDKLAQDMIKLQHEQEAAISQRDAFEKKIEQTRDEHARAHQLTIESKQALEAVQAKVNAQTAQRNERLEKLNSPVVASPGRAAVVGEPGSPLSSTERVPTTASLDTDKAAAAERAHMDKAAEAGATSSAAPPALPPRTNTGDVAAPAAVAVPAKVGPLPYPVETVAPAATVGPLPYPVNSVVPAAVNEVGVSTSPTAPPRHPVAVAHNVGAGLT